MKLEKLSLESMKFSMPVLADDFLINIVGGYSNDCFWRCVAYLSGGGYSERDAEYYADSFKPEGGYYYNNDAGVSDEDMKRYQRENFNSFQGSILKIDPSKVPGLSGSGYHAVIYKSTDSAGGYVVYDPQQDMEYTIPANALEKTYVFAGSGSGSSGSGSNGNGTSGSGSGSGSGSIGSYGYY